MIYINKLTRQFDKRGLAGIHELNFKLERGKIMAIMGPNGGGKSTLLKTLAGIISPDSGTISIDGKVRLFPSSDLVSEINVLKLLVESVKLEVDEDKKIQLARDLADTFEFTFQLKQNLKELSSGQLQKVLLSIELINRPEVLLMDEPFAHLDPFTRNDILKNLFTHIKQQDMTILWVTHDLDEALKYSDLLGLMNFGKFEQLSSPLDMIRKPRNLFVAQFMGYRNFFSVKFKEDQCLSLWGPLKPFSRLDKDDAILVVPDGGWEIREEGPSFSIKDRYPAKQSLEYILERENVKVFLQKSSQEEILEIDQEINLYPDLNKSFLIPL